MVRTGRFFAYALFFVLALMYLMPKASIYYFFEEQLRPYALVINNEGVNEGTLGLEITDAELFINAIESAQIGTINLNLFILFNAVDMHDITLSSVAAAIMPVHIHDVKIRYWVFNPFEITIDGEGEMGTFHATFNLSQRLIRAYLRPSEDMARNYKNTLAGLKLSENGEYLYEKNI